jgi:Protein of unknown function (DUF3300)
MKSLSKILRGSCAIVTSGALVFSTLPTMAQDQPPPGAQLLPPGAGQPPGQTAAQQLGQAELEKLLAPIALYPDDLVAQILTASTYPIEVVQAERWVSTHRNVHGDALQDAMQQEPWDASVKGLAAVPQVLSMMNDKLDWTQQLGEAFLAQPDDVSNAIQQLRSKAQANGNLKSSDKIRVSRVAPPEPPPPPGPAPVDVDPSLLPPPPPPEYIVIEPVDPGVYYVPVYDPYVAYGPWLWPAYRPFYWYPPGYVVGAAVVGFGVGFLVGSALWCHYNWGYYGGGYGWRGGGPVTINVVNYNRFNRTNFVAERNGFSGWRFDAAHRGTVGFQNASLRQQFGEPKNFQNFQNSRGTLQGNLQGSQGQFHIQGNQGNPQQGNQGNALQGNQGKIQGNQGKIQGNQGNALQGNQGKIQGNQGNALQGNQGKIQGNQGNKTFQGNQSLTRGGNANANTNANNDTNVNRNLNINRNQNQNQNQNVNRNLNVNRNFNGGGGEGGGNFNRGGNFSRNAGPPPGGGGGGKGGGGGGGKGSKPDDHGHQ